MMLKALIADDKPKVIALIKHLVDWDDIGIEIIGEVGNGTEAFDLIISKKTDIVITDIRMPGIDELELIR